MFREPIEQVGLALGLDRLGLTARDRRLAILAAVALYGWTGKGTVRFIARGVSSAGLVSELLGYAQEQRLFRYPELMNGYFKTDGQLSATRGHTDAAALKAKGVMKP